MTLCFALLLPFPVKCFSFIEGNVNIAHGLLLYENVFDPDELQSMEEETTRLENEGIAGRLVGESFVKTSHRTMILCGYHYQYFETTERRKGVWNEVPVEPVRPWMVYLHSDTQKGPLNTQAAKEGATSTALISGGEVT